MKMGASLFCPHATRSHDTFLLVLFCHTDVFTHKSLSHVNIWLLGVRHLSGFFFLSKHSKFPWSFPARRISKLPCLCQTLFTSSVFLLKYRHWNREQPFNSFTVVKQFSAFIQFSSVYAFKDPLSTLGYCVKLGIDTVTCKSFLKPLLSQTQSLLFTLRCAPLIPSDSCLKNTNLSDCICCTVQIGLWK